MIGTPYRDSLAVSSQEIGCDLSGRVPGRGGFREFPLAGEDDTAVLRRWPSPGMDLSSRWASRRYDVVSGLRAINKSGARLALGARVWFREKYRSRKEERCT